MSYIVPKDIPNCCGRCPCFHAEKLMYCQAVKADKNKRIYAPYGEGRPDWCPLVEVKTPHGRLGDLDELIKKYGEWYTEEGTESGYIGTMKNLLDGASTVIEAEE